MPRQKKRKASSVSQKEAPAAKIAKQIDDVESSSASDSASTTTTSSSRPAAAEPPKPKSSKLAARRAKVLSYEAQLAPQPDPLKGVQKGAKPAKSEAERRRVEQLASHMRKLEEDEEKRERLRKQEEEHKKRLDLTATHHRRGVAKTSFDVWEAHPEQMAKKLLLEEKAVGEEWVGATLPKPVKAPSGFHERLHPTKLPAVEVAPAGTSYRPAYEDQQAVLAEVLAKRIKNRKKRRQLHDAVQPIKKGLKRKHRNISEYTAGLEDVLGIPKQEDTTTATNDEDAVAVARKRPIASSRWSLKMSKTERNKLKKRENRRKTKKYKRLLKKRHQELEALPKLVKELTKEEREHQTELERRQAEKEAKAGTTKKLTRYPFATQPTPYILTDEIPSALRQMAPLPEYNPLKERFISLQRRNLIEARVRVSSSRAFRVKRYTPTTSQREWAVFREGVETGDGDDAVDG